MKNFVFPALVLALFAQGCGPKANAEDCTAMLDHMIDLQAKKSGKEAAVIKKAMEDHEEYKKVVDECLGKLPLTTVQCVVRAQSVEEANICK